MLLAVLLVDFYIHLRSASNFLTAVRFAMQRRPHGVSGALQAAWGCAAPPTPVGFAEVGGGLRGFFASHKRTAKAAAVQHALAPRPNGTLGAAC